MTAALATLGLEISRFTLAKIIPTTAVRDHVLAIHAMINGTTTVLIMKEMHTMMLFQFVRAALIIVSSHAKEGAVDLVDRMTVALIEAIAAEDIADLVAVTDPDLTVLVIGRNRKSSL
jgi:hypothetical protein